MISIVVPFYNEETSIEAFFAESRKVVRRLNSPVEYVCVDDGSTDRTSQLLSAQSVAPSTLVVVTLARNFGKEAALSAGLRQARGDAVVVMDGDLQDPPHLILEFVAKWRDGFDVVYGVRRSRSSDSLLKRLTASLFYRAFNFASDTPIPVDVGDFRLMDRRVVDALLELPERNRFMKGLFAWVGFRQTGIPYERPARPHGSTRWKYWALWNFALDGITSFSTAPLRFSSLAGVAISLGAFAYAAFLVSRTLIRGADVPGYASIMVMMMFLGGIQLIFLGVIGEYLGRLYLEAKKRPLYIISEIYKSERVLHTGSSTEQAQRGSDDWLGDDQVPLPMRRDQQPIPLRRNAAREAQWLRAATLGQVVGSRTPPHEP